MNTIQIYQELKKDHYANKIFKSVYARDQLPYKFRKPCAFVVNTHKSNQPGQHWLAFYFDNNGSCEFFDSFGLHPSRYNFNDYILKNSNSFKYNNNQIQHASSSYCGHYCVYFIMLKARGVSLETIQKIFSDSNQLKNDSLIKNLL